MITIRKPEYQWLFGGFGFHNSEATMTGLMTPEFRSQRVLKTFREISPTFSRVFAGYADWTREAMEDFAVYYEQTFKPADTTLFAVPGRIPPHETHEEMEAYAENFATRLSWLVHKRGVRHIRYYCATNELSVGNTYALLRDDMPRFQEYQTLLWRAFKRYSLPIGLVGSDGSGFQSFWQIDWVAVHMDEITEAYCAHNYEAGGFAYDDPGFYELVYREVSRVVRVALEKQKRFLLGEFGQHDTTHFASPVMRSDVFSGYGDPRLEAETALMAAVQAIAVINAGALALAYWTMVDYPDPLLKDWSDTPEGQKRYEMGRFSGHGTEIRYNKNGLFRWNDEEHDYSSRPFLYSIGLLAKYFKKHARLLECKSTDEHVLCCAMRNPDLTCSICLINLAAEAADAQLTVDVPLDKPFRRYDYAVDAVPYNDCNDLQDASALLDAPGGTLRLPLPAHSMTLLTTDYRTYTPAPLANLSLCDGLLSWSASTDERHRYYRVYCGGTQIASTVDETLNVGGARALSAYTVRDVDRDNNQGV